MEADEYFKAYEALKQSENDGASRRLTINTRDPAGIYKIILSSFDFMTGPELRFVWDISSSRDILTPVNLSGEEGSDTRSFNSSVSVTSAQFEDIDDPLQNPLVSLHPNLSFSHYGAHSVHSGESPGYYLDDYMAESRSTLTGGSSTIHDNGSGSRFEDSSSSAELSELQKNQSKTPLNTNFEDASPRPPRSDSEKSTETFVSEDSESSFTKIVEETYAQLSHVSKALNYDNDLPSTSSPYLSKSPIFSSCMDSGIAATVSMHSDLSAICNSPAAVLNDNVMQESTVLSRRRFSSSSDDIALETEVPLEVPTEQPDDENFIVKFVLAEQICSTQIPLNPLITKIASLPSRSLSVLCYLFSLRLEKEDKQLIYSISMLLPHKKLKWLLHRQLFFESVAEDFVPRFKASLFKEDFEDSIIRMTSEFTHFLTLISSLERFPLVPSTGTLKVKHTLLSEANTSDDKLLLKALSGMLQCQGYCVIIGSDHQQVSKLLFTLCLFVPEELRWQCIRAYRHEYSPYIRIQAVKRSELRNVVLQGAKSDWPICIVDLDRKVVCTSASYLKHRQLKARAEAFELQTILGKHTKTKPNIQLELHEVKPIDELRWFLQHLDLLPFEESARIGFIDQFLLYFENMASAFVEYVEATSAPKIGEKACGIKSSKFSLAESRRALNLRNDALFNIVIAQAELQRPQIVEFIYQ